MGVDESDKRVRATETIPNTEEGVKVRLIALP